MPRSKFTQVPPEIGYAYNLVIRNCDRGFKPLVDEYFAAYNPNYLQKKYEEFYDAYRRECKQDLVDLRPYTINGDHQKITYYESWIDRIEANAPLDPPATAAPTITVVPTVTAAPTITVVPTATAAPTATDPIEPIPLPQAEPELLPESLPEPIPVVSAVPLVVPAGPVIAPAVVRDQIIDGKFNYANEYVYFSDKSGIETVLGVLHRCGINSMIHTWNMRYTEFSSDAKDYVYEDHECAIYPLYSYMRFKMFILDDFTRTYLTKYFGFRGLNKFISFGNVTYLFFKFNDKYVHDVIHEMNDFLRQKADQWLTRMVFDVYQATGVNIITLPTGKHQRQYVEIAFDVVKNGFSLDSLIAALPIQFTSYEQQYQFYAEITRDALGMYVDRWIPSFDKAFMRV